MRILSLVGRHSRAWRLGSLMGAFAVLCGGLVLGMNSAAGSSAPAQVSSSLPAKVVQPSRHYVVGTIFQAFKNGQVIVRGRAGRFFVVDLDGSTIVRQDRRGVPAASLRRGTRVIILGEPKDGRLHAAAVTITGSAPVPPLPSAPTSPRPPETAPPLSTATAPPR